MRFLCGCEVKIEQVPKPQRFEVISTFDAVSYDGEGFLICTIHNQRRRGWRAPMPRANGQRHMSDIQWQALDVFGIPVPTEDLKLTESAMPDLRPVVPTEEEITASVMGALAAVAANGHHEQSDGKAFRENLFATEAEIVRRHHVA